MARMLVFALIMALVSGSVGFSPGVCSPLCMSFAVGVPVSPMPPATMHLVQTEVWRSCKDLY